MRGIIKSSLKSSIGAAIGVTIGGSLLPRLFNSNHYNETLPLMLKYIAVYFIFGYIGAFIMSLIINTVKKK